MEDVGVKNDNGQFFALTPIIYHSAPTMNNTVIQFISVHISKPPLLKAASSQDGSCSGSYRCTHRQLLVATENGIKPYLCPIVAHLIVCFGMACGITVRCIVGDLNGKFMTII